MQIFHENIRKMACATYLRNERHMLVNQPSSNG